MNKEPLISIVVPVYNVEQYLDACINSVRNQTYTNWELILVDDGSTDRSSTICDKYVENDSRIRVIHKKNGGLSSARNEGIKLIRGEYVTFLDSDDFLHIECLYCMYNLCIQHSADISQCSFIRGEEASFPKISLNEKIIVYDNHSIFTQQGAKIITCGKLYKAHLLQGIQFPVGKINEDDFTTWKFYYKAKKIVVTNIPLYYYTCNPKSIMATQRKKIRFDFLEAYKERIDFFIQSGEKDLEDMSRMQLCKSLVLTYGIQSVTQENKIMLKNIFIGQWRCLLNSFSVPLKFKLIFHLFAMAPSFTSKLIRNVI